MAIQYRLLQNRIKGSKNYGKYYAHTVRRGTVPLEDIEERIAAKCTATPADVRLFIRALYDEVKFIMQMGHTVDLRELGKLSIAIKSVCVDRPEDFDPKKHITGYQCKYNPQSRRYHTKHDDKSGHCLYRNILDGCVPMEIK